MGRLLILKLSAGDFDRGFDASLQICQDGIPGLDHVIPNCYLPAIPSTSAPEELSVRELLRQWQLALSKKSDTYSLKKLELVTQLKEEVNSVSDEVIIDCEGLTKQLKEALDDWFASSERGWRKIRTELESLESEDKIIIQTDYIGLQKLPLSECDIFKNKQLEVPIYKTGDIRKATIFIKPKKRILVVIGNTKDLKVDDASLVQSLSKHDVIVETLKQPSRKDLIDKLLYDRQGWDIFFFTGHSGSEENGSIGYIEINQHERMLIDEFKETLQETINNGLQLAIFNSCDGLGLANQLAQLNLPQSIVMREEIPERVAYNFLEEFLAAFSQGQSINDSVRQARIKLRESEYDWDDKKYRWEKEFPGISWLPVIYQNPGCTPFRWIPPQPSPQPSPQPLPQPSPQPLRSKVPPDWGESPAVDSFFGRTQEIEKLKKWIVQDKCRLVTIVGIGGIGKTTLAKKLGKGGIGKTDLSLQLAQGIQDEFDYVIWRRLLSKPDLKTILNDLITYFSDEQETAPNQEYEQISMLLYYLQKHRCLVVLDNLESVLEAPNQETQEKIQCISYQNLLTQIATREHNSCLLLTSREIPTYISYGQAPILVRLFELEGLNYMDGRKIVESKRQKSDTKFSGSDDEWKELIEFYEGNPLVLELVAPVIEKRYNGNISEFLKKGKPIFSKLEELLDWHFDRLSDKEQEIMYWLAIDRELVPKTELKEDICSNESKIMLDETLQSLQRLIPLEKPSNNEQSWGLQPVLMKYVIDRLIKEICQEIETGDITEFSKLNRYALVKATAKTYIREDQSRNILRELKKALIYDGVIHEN